MAASLLKPGSGKELRRLLTQLTSSAAEQLGSLIAREFLLQPAELLLTDAEALLASLTRPTAVVRGALDKDFAGRNLFALLEVADASALAGHLMLTPEHLIEERRALPALEGEQLQAFGELANVLCAALGSVLRTSVGNADLRLQDHGSVKPGADPQHLLPAAPLFACKLRVRVANHPESVGWLLLDLATAEAWNRAPLEGQPVEAGDARARPGESGNKPDDDLEDIPAAPVRGELNAYLACNDALLVLRRSCRRVGLELRRHARAEIPNPAAHKGGIVLLDVPTGDDRRFDWCRRIKDFGYNTRVVLLLHRPSRARVAQAFRSQADVILGLPLDESQLSHRLGRLLAAAAAAAAPGAEGPPTTPTPPPHPSPAP